MTMIGKRLVGPDERPDMGIRIVLSDLELRYGRAVGRERHAEALRLDRQDAHDFVGDPEEIHIAGALGELACAKALNLYYVPTVNTFQRGGDVGPYQVRTRSELRFQLMVRTNAVDDDIYVLVRGDSACHLVVGWIRAGDAKRPEWLHPHAGREPAYFVPDTHLLETKLLL